MSHLPQLRLVPLHRDVRITKGKKQLESWRDREVERIYVNFKSGIDG